MPLPTLFVGKRFSRTLATVVLSILGLCMKMAFLPSI